MYERRNIQTVWKRKCKAYSSVGQFFALCYKKKKEKKRKIIYFAAEKKTGCRILCYSTVWATPFAMCYICQMMLINKVNFELLANSSEDSLAPTDDITFS